MSPPAGDRAFRRSRSAGPARWARLAPAAVAAAALGSAGCLQTTVVRDGWADFAADAAANGGQVTLGRDPGAVGEALRGRRAGDRPHRLRLLLLEGPARVADAQEASMLARSRGGLREVTVVDADGVAVVYAGRYADARDPAAKRALKAVRRLDGADGTAFEGERPFRDAELVTLAGAGTPENALAPADPLDLRGHPGLFSLQVGFFDAAAKPDRFAAAERWANQLRRDDDLEAFYHHGPNRSLVTVGLFRRLDFVDERQPDGSWVQGYPPAARKLQERFPHNLGNGNTVLEKRRGGAQSEPQKSYLVKTPG